MLVFGAGQGIRRASASSRLRATADQFPRLHRLAPIAAVVAAVTIIGGIFMEHPTSTPNAVWDGHERTSERQEEVARHPLGFK